MKTTSTPRRPKPNNQCAIALDLLERARPGWVGVDTIMREARTAAAHSCISKLRTKYGWNIENRQSTAKDGRRLSSYRLVPNSDDQP